MSDTSIRNPVDPIEGKDIRSAGLQFKYDKDLKQKWSNGVRPMPGVKVDCFTGEVLMASNEVQKIRVRPSKSMTSAPKSHANKNPKPFGHYDSARHAHKADAVREVNDHTTSSLSKSLLELLPQHANNSSSAVQIALRESAAAADADILYSFDNKGPSPGDKGRSVDLGGLVDLAEKKFLSQQIDRIVKGEYEVLDNDGETTNLTRKGKKSPKQKATKVVSAQTPIHEVDGFELV